MKTLNNILLDIELRSITLVEELWAMVAVMEAEDDFSVGFSDVIHD